MYGTRLAIQDQIKRAKSRKPKETIGAILNISSLAAQYALFNTPLYCASKAGVSSFTRTLSPLHEEYGIKVVAVSPGMVKTPLWTEHPEKMRGLAAQDEFLTPEEMAEAMITVVESDKYLGGTVLEVIKNRTRVVNVDSPLPSGPGSTMSNIGVIYEETIGLLEKERTS
jgi:3-hydroxybutyrate dehydrogenase